MSNNSLNEMLKKASKEIGTDPESLKKATSSGKINDLLSKLGNKKSEQIKEVLSDKQKMSKLLSTSKAKELFKKFLGEK